MTTIPVTLDTLNAAIKQSEEMRQLHYRLLRLVDASMGALTDSLRHIAIMKEQIKSQSNQSKED
jgi:hypothetical protein